jgi:hypothetical protein
MDRTLSDNPVLCQLEDFYGHAHQKKSGGISVRLAYIDILGQLSDEKPYSWFLVSGTLPPGLTFDPATGLLTGTLGSVTTQNLTFEVSDILGGASRKLLTLTVN